MSMVFELFGGASALVYLCAALALFAVSTFQMSFAARAILWLLGAGLVAAVGFHNWALDRDGLVALAADARAYAGDGAWARALRGNQRFVLDYFNQLQDLFVAFGAVFGLGALIALLPGEAFDRALRVVLLTTVGAVLGAVITIELVAIGFGGYPERAVYVAAIGTDRDALLTGEGATLVDGDTFKLGDLPVRLAWIDTPEFEEDTQAGEPSLENQIGYAVEGGDPIPLGTLAREALADEIAGGLLVCDRLRRDRWGRALVECLVRKDGAEFDLAEAMLRSGAGVLYPDMSPSHPKYAGYEAAQTQAIEQRLGVWATCTLHPRVWRNAREAQKTFRDDARIDHPEDALDGQVCAELGILQPPGASKTTEGP